MARDPTALPIQGSDSLGGNPLPTYPAPVGQTGGVPTQKQTFNNVTNDTTFTVSLAAEVGRTNYLCGFYVAYAGSTAGGIVDVTLTGLLGTTIHMPYAVPTGVANAGPLLFVSFNPPLQASGQNQALTLTVSAAPAGNVQASGGIWGYSQ